jgi:hypothetical protein
MKLRGKRLRRIWLRKMKTRKGLGASVAWLSNGAQFHHARWALVLLVPALLFNSWSIALSKPREDVLDVVDEAWELFRGAARSRHASRWGEQPPDEHEQQHLDHRLSLLSILDSQELRQ